MSTAYTRVDGRALDETRQIKFVRKFTNAAGNVLASAGDTIVLCAASVVEDVPEWMKRDPNSTKGWITAEYRMLPSSAQTRKPRQDRPDGRATEIQRLIGRAARAVFEPDALGPRTIYLDCDVLQADGGTRTISISGAFVALVDAIQSIRDRLPNPERFPLRDAVAMVLQKNELFSGTIKENLRWGKADATDEELVAVCKTACADDFIRSFPDGYDTMLGQGGTSLSGGQKQRLCIARALLKDPKILILDDSTSAVDTATDAQIRAGFRTRFGHVTTLIIAQRIASVEEADRIVILDNGKIADVGSHDELLARSEIYREIYESQKKGVA